MKRSSVISKVFFNAHSILSNIIKEKKESDITITALFKYSNRLHESPPDLMMMFWASSCSSFPSLRRCVEAKGSKKVFSYLDVAFFYETQGSERFQRSGGLPSVGLGDEEGYTCTNRRSK